MRVCACVFMCVHVCVCVCLCAHARMRECACMCEIVEDEVISHFTDESAKKCDFSVSWQGHEGVSLWVTLSFIFKVMTVKMKVKVIHMNKRPFSNKTCYF